MKIVEIVHEQRDQTGTLTVYRYFGQMKASFISAKSFSKSFFGITVASVEDAKNLETMIEEKFTPGEWDSAPDFSGDIYDSEGYYIAGIYSRGGHCVAGIYERDTPEETHANAMLIRAAPRLYYALKNLLPHIEALMPQNGEYGELAAADIQAAHDAIAKANGEK